VQCVVALCLFTSIRVCRERLVCCSVLQCVAVRCSVLLFVCRESNQCVAVCCSETSRVERARKSTTAREHENMGGGRVYFGGMGGGWAYKACITSSSRHWRHLHLKNIRTSQLDSHSTHQIWYVHVYIYKCVCIYMYIHIVGAPAIYFCLQFFLLVFCRHFFLLVRSGVLVRTKKVPYLVLYVYIYIYIFTYVCEYTCIYM